MADIKFFDRVEMSTATTGTGLIEFAGPTSSDLITPLEAGANDGDQVTYVIEEGTDWEIGLGTIGNTASTMTRDVVYRSRKVGVIGTDKLDLGGTAIARLMPSGDAFNQLWSTTSYWGKSGDVVHAADYTFVVANGDSTAGFWHVFNKASAVTGNLPALATTLSESYLVRNVGTGTLTLEPNGSEQIENLVNLAVPQGRAMFIWPNHDRSMWRAITLGFDFANPLMLTDFTISGGNFSAIQGLTPVNNALAIGGTSNPFSGIYLRGTGGAVGVDFGNGDITIKGVSGTLTFAGASVGGYQFDQAVRPVTAGNTDLGTGAVGWGHLFLSGTKQIAWDAGIGGAMSLTHASGVIQVSVGIFELLGGQLKFPASQNASSDANTFDDYEEGTFTPTAAFNGSATGVTYSNQSAIYTKLGRVVIAHIQLTLSSNGTGVGAATLTALPFSAGGAVNYACVVTPLSGFTGLVAGVAGNVTAGATTVALRSPNTTGSGVVTDTEMTNSASLYVTCPYTV